MKLKFTLFCLLAGLSLVLFNACQKEESIGTKNLSNDELIENFSKGLNKAMANADFRKFVKDEALKQIDFDYDVVWILAKDNSLRDGRTANEHMAQFIEPTELALISERLPLLNIAVPLHISSWDTDKYEPSVIFKESTFEERTGMKLKGYDSNGQSILVGEEDVPEVPFLVVGESERMVVDALGDVVFDKSLVFVEKRKEDNRKFFDFGNWSWPFNWTYVPGPTCPEDYGTRIYLTGLMSENLGNMESWFSGAPELRLNVIDGGAYYPNPDVGTNIMNAFWEPEKRKHINDTWWNIDDFLYEWVSTYGSSVYFRWDEEDGGVLFEDIQEANLGGDMYTVPIFLKSKSDLIGYFQVYLDYECPFIYGNTTLKFKIDKRN